MTVVGEAFPGIGAGEVRVLVVGRWVFCLPRPRSLKPGGLRARPHYQCTDYCAKPAFFVSPLFGVVDAPSDLGDGVIDQANRPLTMAALVGARHLQFGARRA